jgi:hypothetical protein
MTDALQQKERIHISELGKLEWGRIHYFNMEKGYAYIEVWNGTHFSAPFRNYRAVDAEGFLRRLTKEETGQLRFETGQIVDFVAGKSTNNKPQAILWFPDQDTKSA